jgi:hypothetical protein
MRIVVRALGPRRVLWVAAFVLLPATAFVLRVAGMQRTRAALAWIIPQRVNAVGEEGARSRAVATDAIVRAVASRSPFGATCLPRALVLQSLLRAQGVASQLRIGARKGEDGFEAHAWVACLGTALGAASDDGPEFVPFSEKVDIPMRRGVRE